MGCTVASRTYGSAVVSQTGSSLGTPRDKQALRSPPTPSLFFCIFFLHSRHCFRLVDGCDNVFNCRKCAINFVSHSNLENPLRLVCSNQLWTGTQISREFFPQPTLGKFEYPNQSFLTWLGIASPVLTTHPIHPGNL